MALMTATPSESPLGTAVASAAIVTALLDELVSRKVLTLPQTGSVIKTAMVLISGYSDSEPHESARITLMRMLKDRGMA
jgi:hypothetical protein